jgi:tetratricopeptide (TPR) repeat protein
LWKLDWDTQAQRWQGLSKEQRTALLAHIESLAKGQPSNADVQVRLGEAYVQMLLAPGTGFLEMGKWGQLADRQFTKALELDDHHWDARFNKAMGLAHQPAILGSRPKAIEHFEILIAQQEKLSPEPRHADVYLVLGNLLAEQGDKEKARTLWETGRRRHPESRELAEKVKD